MKPKDEVKKELSYDQVQRIIDNQIARIEEEEIGKQQEFKSQQPSNDRCRRKTKQCCVVRFFKKLFGQK